MRKETRYALRAARLLAAVALALISGVAHADVTGVVTHVRDGDTLEIGDRAVRFQGIDAPESDQPFGDHAGALLRERVDGERVRVEVVGEDRYGRLIGVVHHRGTNLNAWLVERGAAWVYDRYNDNTRWPELEAAARANRRGLWASVNPVPPWEWRRR